MANDSFTEQIRFQPYVGPTYEKTKTKVLILGESHYGSQRDEHKDFTVDVVENWLTGVYKLPFFDNILRALFGNNDHARAKFGQLAFYNYLQVFKGETARDSSFLQQEHIYEAEQPFYEVLRALTPDVVLCFSYRVWNEAPWGDAEHDAQLPNSANELELWQRVYQANAGLDKPIPMYKLKHPSAGFSHSKYHALLCTIPELSEYTVGDAKS
ncbi:MAG: hypothetical protein LBT12_06920 [Oscillospiraceae bacterium]|nr:hypothetical protein [Oscillospiraceae bacterium]